MKRLLTAGMAVGGVLMIAGLAVAGTLDPGVNARQRNQERRIEQGRQSGQLAPREYRRLERQQIHIRHTERRMKADGRFTARERARLHHKQNQASRNIYCLKHNQRRFAR
ncbi:MAG: hypothetical protein AB1439_12045 [candidate division FCPU426 bacterium]